MKMQKMFQEFYLLRKIDESGVSGVGVVARGVIFPEDTRCVVRWCGEHNTITIFDSIEEVEFIHGHEGKTVVVMGNPEKVKKPRKKPIKVQ